MIRAFDLGLSERNEEFKLLAYKNKSTTDHCSPKEAL